MYIYIYIYVYHTRAKSQPIVQRGQPETGDGWKAAARMCVSGNNFAISFLLGIPLRGFQAGNISQASCPSMRFHEQDHRRRLLRRIRLDARMPNA